VGHRRIALKYVNCNTWCLGGRQKSPQGQSSPQENIVNESSLTNMLLREMDSKNNALALMNYLHLLVLSHITNSLKTWTRFQKSDSTVRSNARKIIRWGQILNNCILLELDNLLGHAFRSISEPYSVDDRFCKIRIILAERLPSGIELFPLSSLIVILIYLMPFGVRYPLRSVTPWYCIVLFPHCCRRGFGGALQYAML
jgi:hypothetical protein